MLRNLGLVTVTVAPALQLLSEIHDDANAEWVFPNRKLKGRGPQRQYYASWQVIRTAAKVPDLRVHDLRHSFASEGAGLGLSLLIIGKLLGHTNPNTTARYAHLLDDPLREATEAIGRRVAGPGEKSVDADVVPLHKGGVA